MLDFFMDEFEEMFDEKLDEIDQSNNTVIRHMNGRVDEIREGIDGIMHDHDRHMMEFLGMALGMPALGFGLHLLGAPVAATALLGMAPMYYLMMFMQEGDSRQEPVPVYHHDINVTIPLGEHLEELSFINAMTG